MSRLGWLAGRVALVTGGASGIGAAVVERFVAEGAHVAVLDRRPLDPARIAAIGEGNLLALEGDVTSAADNRRAVADTVSAFGSLDVFVGNAGIYDGAVRLEAMTDDQFDAAFDEIFAVNVKGYLRGVRAAAHELERVGGSVILTLSNAAFYAGGGGVLYTASKHAGVGLVRELAHELAPRVRVNGVAPAGTVTDLRGPAGLGQAERGFFDDGTDWAARIAGTKPLGFSPAPSAHAGAYVYLASTENSGAVTGEVLRSDGGLAARGL